MHNSIRTQFNCFIFWRSTFFNNSYCFGTEINYSAERPRINIMTAYLMLNTAPSSQQFATGEKHLRSTSTVLSNNALLLIKQDSFGRKTVDNEEQRWFTHFKLMIFKELGFQVSVNSLFYSWPFPVLGYWSL